MRSIHLAIAGILCTVTLTTAIKAQDVESALLTFNRGKLWHSLYLGKSGPAAFNNWQKSGIGWDWPGFDPSKVKDEVFGAPSYLASGGMYIGCKRADDSVMTFEDWAMTAASIQADPAAKYIVKKHRKYSNIGQLKDKNKGDEYIETVWEYNPNWPNSFEPWRQAPIRVKRTAHQWNGSRREENYIIYEYVIKNIANELSQYKKSRKIVDSLYNFYLMFGYAIHANSRSQTIFSPGIYGARNTTFQVDTTTKDFNKDAANKTITRNMVYGRSLDFGYSENMGQRIKKDQDATEALPSGEWLAPAFSGIRLLYSTPDKIRKTAGKVNKYGWSAVDDTRDLAGPISLKTGKYDEEYAVLADPANAYRAVQSKDDPLMGKSRMWSLMSLGPWDLMPGDSIVIAVAEIVDGIDYEKATGRNKITSKNLVNNLGRDEYFMKSADRAKFTYDNGMDHPDAPVAPSFSVDFYKERERFVANLIEWSDSLDNQADPDDGAKDLAGYRLYRSEYLPIGPWEKVGEVLKGDIKHHSAGRYSFVDSSVEIGTSYYYALTAFDQGRDSWNINPKARFTETNSIKVPSLESSVFANRAPFPFVSTLVPPKTMDNILVVPNPFVIGEGFTQPGDQDVIQFVNVPNPCTIRIYSLRGDLVKTLRADEGTGAIVSWNQATDYGQFVTSGIYIYHVESPLGTKIGKLAIIR